MGLRSYLGLGSSKSSPSSDSGYSSAQTSGDWYRYDEAAARRQPRESHPLPAQTDSYGRRVISADPYSRPDSSTRRNFGRPYSDGA